MNTLLASEAKVNCALVGCRGRGALAEAQQGDAEEVNDLLMRVARQFGIGEWFVMLHGQR